MCLMLLVAPAQSNSLCDSIRYLIFQAWVPGR
jgi:hypothetical protein